MHPKLFISYSWTNEEHQNYVLKLASELRESGIDVILDKWDLKEGHDAHSFMEKMVSDPEIKKVALICDNAYVTKANKRQGGVGTETQIITPEIYSKQDQSKFVAIVTERNSEGEPFLPVYYKSRIYIDLSDDENYSTEFERIVRWVYDKPIYKKPEIGSPPSFLMDDERAINLGTSARFRRAKDALKNGKEFSVAAVREYFSTLSQEMEKFRISGGDTEFDEQVIISIENFTPYRDELVDIIETIAVYRDDSETRNSVHRFFETLIPYLNRPGHINQWHEWDFDNFRFIIHEIYLYALAIYIKHERFQSADALMREYYVNSNENIEEKMNNYIIFREYLKSFEHRNKRLGLRRLSLRADFLKNRCNSNYLKFEDLMQADFILYFRSCQEDDFFKRWWPETMLYSDRYSGAMEVFARSKSRKYFEACKILIQVNSLDDLVSRIEKINSDPERIPKWQFRSISPEQLIGIKYLCKAP